MPISVENGAALVPRQAFDVADGPHFPAVDDCHYTHNRWGSVFLDLGVHCPARHGQRNHMSEYTKAPDQVIRMLYESTLMGPWALFSPTILSDFGFLPGLALLLGCASVGAFFAIRFLEVPQLISSRGMATYSDVIREVFGGSFVLRYLGRLVASLACCAVFTNNLFAGFKYWALCLGAKEHGIVEAGLLGICILFTAWRYSWASLRMFAHCSMLAVKGAFGIVLIVTGLQALFTPWGPGPGTVIPNRGSPGVLMLGQDLSIEALSTSSIVFLPSLVSEMATPQSGRRLFQSAYVRCGCWQVILAAAVNWTWGRSCNMWHALSEGNEASLILQKSAIFLLGVRCIATLPVLLWVWVREVDAWTALDRMPEVLLGLPWAIQRARRMQQAIPPLLVLAVILADRMVGIRPLIRNTLGLQLTLLELWLTPCMCFLTVRIYRRRLAWEDASLQQQSQTTLDGAPRSLAPPRRRLVFGGLRHQFGAIAAVCALSLLMGAFAVVWLLYHGASMAAAEADAKFHTHWGEVFPLYLTGDIYRDLGFLDVYPKR